MKVMIIAFHHNSPAKLPLRFWQSAQPYSLEATSRAGLFSSIGMVLCALLDGLFFVYGLFVDVFMHLVALIFLYRANRLGGKHGWVR